VNHQSDDADPASGSGDGDSPPNDGDDDTDETGTRRLTDALWARHANPRSGWSRVLTLPLLMTGIYTRRPRLVAFAVGFAVFNPVLFSPPEDADAWMTRVVLGERMYYRHREGRGAVDLLNYVNGPITAYAVYAAYRRRPVATVVATALSMATKFLFVGYVARYYEQNRDRFPEDVPAFDSRE
jgi:hypothetical protein